MVIELEQFVSSFLVRMQVLLELYVISCRNDVCRTAVMAVAVFGDEGVNVDTGLGIGNLL